MRLVNLWSELQQPAVSCFSQQLDDSFFPTFTERQTTAVLSGVNYCQHGICATYAIAVAGIHTDSFANGGHDREC
jgi:hypothetical protein